MCRCVPFCLGHPMCMLHIWPLKVNLSSHHPSVPRGVNLANRSCVTLSDLCSVQCFRRCTLILKRPIFKALSGSRYRQKAPGQQHMVSSSTSSGHVCMNSERERQSYIDYAYMVKEKLFSWHKLEFLENTYIVKGISAAMQSSRWLYWASNQKRREWELRERAEKGSKLRSCEKMSMCGTLDRAQNKQVKIKPRKMADLHV